jgi:hypothetical protein
MFSTQDNLHLMLLTLEIHTLSKAMVLHILVKGMWLHSNAKIRSLAICFQNNVWKTIRVLGVK